MNAHHVLQVSCPDGPGLVADVSKWIFDGGGNIVENQQFGDALTGRFFLRTAFETADGIDLGGLRESFAPLAQRRQMTWDLLDASAPCRTLILVSRFGHCLNDLLYRWSSGALNLEIPAIVSNHPDLRRLADAYEIPYHHIEVTGANKPEAEARLMALVEELDIDLVVLARYMQILSDDVARALSGRVINIHHSFLPSFKGAKPYHQAFARGVKIIGATAHYVTADLDEGPIIEQDVVRIDHRMTPEQMVVAGEEVEARVLARAVRWHAESRVLRAGQRTIVFS